MSAKKGRPAIDSRPIKTDTQAKRIVTRAHLVVNPDYANLERYAKDRADKAANLNRAFNKRLC